MWDFVLFVVINHYKIVSNNVKISKSKYSQINKFPNANALIYVSLSNLHLFITLIREREKSFPFWR